ncbi:MAG: tetratricopeptide repeat protein [Rhodospirillaceae bacterium]|nr:tetratricopeptide repeat protein [Rhodospirillaceae bacterium]
MTWLRRAAIACGVLGPMVCTAALAEGPIDDALSLVAQQRHAEARKAIEEMLERNPEAPGVRLLQGVLHAREGNLVEAVAIFEGLRNDHPTMFEAHNNLAVLYAKLGRLDDARKALVGALEMRPDAVIYANLGDVYMKLAERAYERAHELRIEQEVAAVEGGEAGAASQAEAAPAEPAAAEPAEEEKEVAALAALPVEPEVVEEPDIPEEPEVLEEAEIVEEPGSPEEPEVLEEAEIPEEPEVVEEPESLEEPEVVEEPVIPEEPEVVEEPESPGEPKEAVVLAARESCIQTGWFDDRKVADEAAAWLREHGAEAVSVRSEEQQIIKNYQVYLPPAESREAAVATVRALRGKGVEDLWIIDRGERIYGVSLGVFRNKRYMSRRVAEVEKLGYVVMTTANMRTATEYTVDAQAGGERAAFDEAWKRAFPEHEIRDIDCADRI